MKLLSLFGGKETTITDDEAVKIYKALDKGSEGMILLQNGDAVNIKGIASITNIPVKQYLCGQEVFFGQYTNGAGERYYLEPEDFKQVRWVYDPKYFGGAKIEVDKTAQLKEVSSFAIEASKKIKSIISSPVNLNPNKVLNKENNWGREEIIKTIQL